MKVIGLGALVACIALFGWMVKQKIDGGGLNSFSDLFSRQDDVAIGNSPTYVTDYTKAMKQSKQTGKPVLLIFSASWCGPCQANKKRLYPHESVQPYHDQFIWAYLDVDDSENSRISQGYRVRGIPSLHTVSSSGQKLESFVGQGNPKEFVAFLEASLKKN